MSRLPARRSHGAGAGRDDPARAGRRQAARNGADRRGHRVGDRRPAAQRRRRDAVVGVLDRQPHDPGPGISTSRSEESGSTATASSRRPWPRARAARSSAGRSRRRARSWPGGCSIAAADTTGALQRARAVGATAIGRAGGGDHRQRRQDDDEGDRRRRSSACGTEVMRSSGNLNNHIGLPLSLLELRHGADVAVVEFGMNHAGEIRRLVEIAEPDVRIWTNVAEVHAAFFDSIDAIADAKAEVLEGASPGNRACRERRRPARDGARGRFAGRIVSFSGVRRGRDGDRGRCRGPRARRNRARRCGLRPGRRRGGSRCSAAAT